MCSVQPVHLIPIGCFRYMKYLYPYECDKRGLSNPNELQAAIDSNRREGRRQSFGTSLFTYSPNGTPTMLSSPKLPTPSVLPVGTNGASLTPIQKIKKGEISVLHCTHITWSQKIKFKDVDSSTHLLTACFISLQYNTYSYEMAFLRVGGWIDCS